MKVLANVCLILTLLVKASTQDYCDPPTVPDGIIYSPENALYWPGTDVYFFCEDETSKLSSSELLESIDNPDSENAPKVFKSTCSGGKFLPELDLQCGETEEPQCEAPRIDGGYHTPDKENFNEGEKITFGCNFAHSSHGNKMSVCGKGGKFVPAIDFHCLQFCNTRNAPKIKNGYFLPADNYIAHLANITYYCDDGSTPTNNPVRTCQDGSFSPSFWRIFYSNFPVCKEAGVWSEWSLGKCSVTCGIGQRQDVRTCTKGSCDGGSSTRTVECIQKPCSAAGATAVGVWGTWKKGYCSATCGKSSRVDVRKCLGGACDGEAERVVQCEVPEKCPEKCVDTSSFCMFCFWASTKRNCRFTCGLCKPEDDYVWSDWIDEGPCSVTCGDDGVINQIRTCQKGTCKGISQQTKSCSDVPECPEENKWSEWVEVGECSATCDEGQLRMERSCLLENCDEVDVKYVSCENKACPGVWGRWKRSGYCSKSCGGGKLRMIRDCTKGVCDGSSTKYMDCETQLCPGEWGEWTVQGECSATCDNGSLKMERQCPFGGCEGEPVKFVPCQIEPCPVLGEWKVVGQCSVTCGEGTMKKARKCLRGKCVGKLVDFVPCQVKRCPEWSSWSRCSATCGPGTRRRHRKCGHNNCARQVEECNRGNCPCTCAKCRDRSFWCGFYAAPCNIALCPRTCNNCCKYCPECCGKNR